MKIKSLISILLVSFLPHSYAQVYKTIDENGKVTFSSIEPTIDKNSTTKVEELDLGTSHDAMTTLSSNLNEKYCGEIKLPSKTENSYSSKYFIKNVTRSKKNWKASLIRLNERMAYNTQKSLKVTTSRYYNSAYNNQRNSSQRKSTDSNLKKMRDLRCAINWSETQDVIISELIATKKSENFRLLEIKTKLESNITAQCGDEPIYDPTLRTNAAQRKRWSTCSRSKRKEIKKIDRQLRALS
ncbi:DUF4124 domain-containing protein [Colwellia psychrerythraea]|uniref:DUF4124 domain-containing protein n=1 Tax=Colwellia psychrerythraea TaxID=28229 RepID=A0A099KDV4_COLPS|nr:DUF4124 domain-containing protein [Colwellia psychrerythraea]KGJ88187.1 protein of unknown function DUF4124 [Colwellia psychrerythraea]